MKSTGIVRKIDQLGRIVLPMELRRTLNIEIKDSLEIFTDKDAIVLKKYQASNTCIVTGEISNDNITLADGKVTLSPKGVEQLLDEVNQRLEESR